MGGAPVARLPPAGWANGRISSCWWRDEHFGFNIKIVIPPGARLTLKHLRVTLTCRPPRICLAQSAGTRAAMRAVSAASGRRPSRTGRNNWRRMKWGEYLSGVRRGVAGIRGRGRKCGRRLGYINIVNLRQPLPAVPASRPDEEAPAKMPGANGSACYRRWRRGCDRRQ